jgi:alkylhydroperoxidase/carboxymuconolactone decarboxylase family protein YurZ
VVGEKSNEKGKWFQISEIGLTQEHFEQTKPFFELLFGKMPMYGQGGLGGYEFASNLWVFGVIFQREGVDIKTRSLGVLSALTVLGRLAVARIWINVCLNIGCTEEEIREAIIFTSHFGGFPAMRDVALLMDDVFAKRRDDPTLKMA